MREMTIGQYYSTDSQIHRLDPRVKIVITFVYVISLFFLRSLPMYGLAFIMITVYIKLSNVPLRYILKGTKALIWFILFTVILQMFTVQGAEAVVEWKFIRITKAGIYSSGYLFLRLIFMIVGSSMMTYTTTPNALTDGLEKLLSWMNRLHVPVHELAMIMSIALRFIPVLTEELDRIMKAQMARGVDFKEGNVFERLRKLMPIIVPLFVSAIRRSNELALAMDARCYHGGEGRTKMKPLEYKRSDYIAYFIVVVYLIALFAIKKMFNPVGEIPFL